MMTAVSDLIGTAAVAEMLGVSVRTVKRQAKRGDLPTVGKLGDTGGTYVFSRAVIEALCDQQVAS